jgi:hypothetical protein
MAGYLSGTDGYIEVPMSATYVKTTESNFNYVFPLSLITDATFWSKISSGANIGVWDLDNSSKCPRYVGGIIDIPSKAGLIYWDAPLTTTNKFRICVGITIAEADALAAFTNSGYYEYWPMCDTSGATAVGINNQLAINGGVTLNVAGKVYKCFQYDGINAYLSRAASVLGTAGGTVDLIVNMDSGSTYYNFFSAPRAGSAHSPSFFRHVSNASLCYQNDNTVNAKSATSSIATGNWYHIAVNIIAPDKCTLYINGVRSGAAAQTISSIAAQIAFWVGRNYDAGSPNWFKGYMEQFGIASDQKSSDNILTRYNMLFSPNTFYGGTYTYVPVSDETIPASAYGKMVQIARIARDSAFSEAVNVKGFDRIAIETPVFTSFLAATSSSIQVYGSDTSTGTFRPIQNQGVYSNSVGVANWKRSMFTGNEYTLVNDLHGVNYIKVQFSTVCSYTYFLRIHKLT